MTVDGEHAQLPVEQRKVDVNQTWESSLPAIVGCVDLQPDIPKLITCAQFGLAADRDVRNVLSAPSAAMRTAEILDPVGKLVDAPRLLSRPTDHPAEVGASPVSVRSAQKRQHFAIGVV